MIPPARSEAIAIARQMIDLHPLYLDTETTGIGSSDEIIQIGILDEDGQIVFESFVKPTAPISPEAERVHGISSADLIDAPRWFHVWPKVEAILTDRTVGVYNLDFEVRLIQQTNARYRIRWNPESIHFFCIMKLYAQFYGERNYMTGEYRYQSLEKAGRQCGIRLPNAHQASQDALLARAVLHYMAQAL